MVMRPVQVIALSILIMLFSCAWIFAQDNPLSGDIFVEGGGSFLNGGSGPAPIYCIPEVHCPSTASSSFSKTGRLFTGLRVHFTPHDAFEVSYSYSPNLFSLKFATESLGSAYNRDNLISFNYVRYLWVKTRVQPFATVGVGGNRFSGPSSASVVVSGFASADNGWQVAVNYGGGADIVLLRFLALRLELRDYVTGQPGLVNGTSHNIVPSAGIVFRFK